MATPGKMIPGRAAPAVRINVLAARAASHANAVAHRAVITITADHPSRGDAGWCAELPSAATSMTRRGPQRRLRIRVDAHLPGLGHPHRRRRHRCRLGTDGSGPGYAEGEAMARRSDSNPAPRRRTRRQRIGDHDQRARHAQRQQEVKWPVGITAEHAGDDVLSVPSCLTVRVSFPHRANHAMPRDPWLRLGAKAAVTLPPAGQPGHRRTASLRRQPTRIVDGRMEDGYADAFELICGQCGDHPYLDYSETSRLQRIRGPYTLEASPCSA